MECVSVCVLFLFLTDSHSVLFRCITHAVYWVAFVFPHQVESEFILESERESFIEQVREVIETADERGLEREGSQVPLPKHLEPLY